MRATADTTAVDQDGITRFVREGDEIPDGWTPDDKSAVEDEAEEPKAAAKKKA
jgi:hypothetical protein